MIVLSTLDELVQKAEHDQSVYLSEIREYIDSLDITNRVRIVAKFDNNSKEQAIYMIDIPVDWYIYENIFREYVLSVVYNILCCIGTIRCHLFYENKNSKILELLKWIKNQFEIEKDRFERVSYGRCINVIERIHYFRTKEHKKFSFVIKPLPKQKILSIIPENTIPIFTSCRHSHTGVIPHQKGKICGLDIGGTSIKCVLSVDGEIVAAKKINWTPFLFRSPNQMIQFIECIVRLFRLWFWVIISDSIFILNFKTLQTQLSLLMEEENDISIIEAQISKIERQKNLSLPIFDAIGIGFPDVVVDNKIVGGECYKTRGMREALGSYYDTEYLKLSNLDVVLSRYARHVFVVNDAIIACYQYVINQKRNMNYLSTATLLHTIGTELGTGWLNEYGDIPAVPMECYNMVIDIGKYPSREYEIDDLRSTRNFNTGISGTVQRYIGQSLFFKVALEYIMKNDLQQYQILLDGHFITEEENRLTCIVNGIDKREKLFEIAVEYLITGDRRKELEQIGVNVIQLWKELNWVLSKQIKEVILTGGCIAQPEVYQSLYNGAKGIDNDFCCHQLKETTDYEGKNLGNYQAAMGAVHYAANHITDL